jgi:tetratricopeptide (TPR) repeat protein
LLVATVDELQHAEPSSIEWVIGTVASLPRPEACAAVDGARVSLRRPEDAARAAAVEDARARLARLEVLRRLGRLESARVEAQALEAEAEDLAYDPLIAEVDLGVARTLGDAGDSEGAIQRLEHAVWIGTALGYRDVVLAASIDLVRATATRPAGASDALAWARRAGALIESSGEDDPSVQIALLRAEAEVRREAGDFDSAEALLSEALSVGSRDPGEAALQEATLRRERAAVLTERADLDAAASDLRQSTRALEQYLGPHHPHHGEAVVELAGVLAESFEQREAMQLYRRALQIFEADLASGSAGAVERLAKTHAKLANSLTLTGEDEDAIAAARRSVELIEQHHGPAHPALALPLVMEAQALVGAGRYAESLGRLERARPLLGSEPRGRAQRKLLAQADMVLSRAAVAQGRIDDAAEAARRNVALMDELTGSDSRETARARLNLGTIYGMSGEHERCILQLEKALPVLEQNFGRLHPYVLLTLNNLSAANRLAGDPDRAVELARQTLELAGDVPDSPIASKGRAHFNLGAAYFDSGRNEEAIAELETALQLYSNGSASGPGELADVQATLGLALWSTDRVRARVLLQHARSGYEAIDTPQSLAAARDVERRLR